MCVCRLSSTQPHVVGCVSGPLKTLWKPGHTSSHFLSTLTSLDVFSPKTLSGKERQRIICQGNITKYKQCPSWTLFLLSTMSNIMCYFGLFLLLCLDCESCCLLYALWSFIISLHIRHEHGSSHDKTVGLILVSARMIKQESTLSKNQCCRK